MNYIHIIYPFIPVVVCSFVALKKDKYKNNVFFGKHNWTFNYILFILSCMAGLQIACRSIFQLNIVSAHNLVLYGPLFVLLSVGVLVYLFVIKRFHVDRKIIGLQLVKNKNNLALPFIIFFIYIFIVFFYAHITNNDQILLNRSKTLHDLQIFKLSILDSVVYVIDLIIIAPVMEEIIYRGVFFAPFERKLGRSGAIWMISLLWSLNHLSINSFLSIFLFGIAFGYLYINTLSLLPSIILHSLINSFSILVYLFDINK